MNSLRKEKVGGRMEERERDECGSEPSAMSSGLDILIENENAKCIYDESQCRQVWRQECGARKTRLYSKTASVFKFVLYSSIDKNLVQSLVATEKGGGLDLK